MAVTYSITDKPMELNLKVRGIYRVKLTPENAAKWLVLNIGNRRVRKTLVEYLKRQIAAGEWQNDHPQPIVFSTSGQLIDGQHRLLALCQSEVSHVVVWVHTGCQEAVREYLDTGIVRTLDDRVALVPDDLKANLFASQIILGFWAVSGQHAKAGRPSPEEARELFALHENAILWAYGIQHRERGVGKAIVSCAAVEYFEKSPEKADDFFRDLFKPAGEVQQAQMLRDWLIRNADRTGSFMARKEAYLKSVSAMKFHLEGKIVKKLYCGGW